MIKKALLNVELRRRFARRQALRRLNKRGRGIGLLEEAELEST